jgi:hypothetical protein
LGQLLERARQTVLETLAHQMTPLALVTQALEDECGADASGFLRVMLLLHDPPLKDLQFGAAVVRERHRWGPSSSPIQPPPDNGGVTTVGMDRWVLRSLTDFTVFARLEGEGLWLFFFHKADLLDSEVMRTWIQRFVHILKAFPNNLDCRLTSFC